MGRHSKPGPEDFDADEVGRYEWHGAEVADQPPVSPPADDATQVGYAGPFYQPAPPPDTAGHYGYPGPGHPPDFAAGPHDHVAGPDDHAAYYAGPDDHPAADPGAGHYGRPYPDQDGYSDGGHYPDESGLPDAGAHPDQPHYPDAGYPAGYPAADYPAADYPAAGGYATPGADEYPDFGSRHDTSESAPDSSANPPPTLFQAGHRESGDVQAGHRSKGGRRGVSIGVIVALVTVVVVVAGIIAWRFIGAALSDRSHTAAARCVGGKDSIAVVTDPSIVDPVKQLADTYNASAGPIGDRCVAVTVKSAGSDAVISGLVGKWPGDLGAQPGLWIPGSSVSAARLAGVTGKQSISDSRSLATSPVLLAIRPEFAQALAKQNWAALPNLQIDPNAMAGLNMAPWGSLRLAVPIAGNSDAAYLAGEAIAAASAPAGSQATSGIGAVRTLMSKQPKLADNSLNEAMNALLKPGIGEVAAASVHAVITTEQQLFQRGQSTTDAKSKLGSWLPPGPVAMADYPTVLLSGSWLSREQTTAASEFARYLRKPEQLAKLAKAGFRVDGAKPPSSPVISFAPLSATLSVGDDAMRATLADAMVQPSSGIAAAIMLDQSLPTDEGGKTRLTNVVAALDDRIKALPPSAVVGLWTFDGREGRSEVAIGPLSDQVNGQPRSAALLAALDKQYSSGGGAVSFTTLRMIYQEMQANFRVGQQNSILVITAGPHTDQSLDGSGLQDFIRTTADPARPVAVNVVDFGSDPDRAAWEGVAQLSGGTYQNLSTSATPNLATAINNFLS